MTEAREVENLLYRYAEAIDAGDFTAVGELFRHGRICAASDSPTKGPVTIAEGADAVAELYRSLVILYDDGTPRTQHVVTNAIIDVDEARGSATSRSSFTVFQATDELPLQPIVLGSYQDTFHRLGGTWWFATRTMVLGPTGDVSRHLRG